MSLTLLLFACGAPSPAPAVECARGTLDSAGGTLEADGATLTLPAGALEREDELELCPLPDGSSWLVRSDTHNEFLVPAMIRVERAGDLFVPEGSLQAHRPEPGVIEGPLYRPGVVRVAHDPRVAVPYEPEPLAIGDVLLVVGDAAFSAAELLPELDGIDYRVGVTASRADNAFLGWVDGATPDAERVLDDFISTAAAVPGTEQGLAAAFHAVALDTDGFGRPEAGLAVVVVSDEHDRTPAHVVTRPEFVDWLDRVRQSPDAADLHALTPEDVVTYRTIAEQTGGSVAPLDAPDEVLEGLHLEGSGMVLGPVVGEVEVWAVPANAEPEPVPATFDRGVLVVTHPHDEELVVLYEPL